MLNEKKLFVVRKYIYAKSAKDAIKKDKTAPIDEIFLDEGFKNQAVAMGFNVKNNDK